MKKISKIFIYLAAILIVVSGCKDDRDIIQISSDPTTYVPPSIANDPSGSVILEFENAADVMEVFSWTASDYGAGVPIKYTLQVDVNDQFEQPVSLASDLSITEATVTVGAMNSAALNLGVEPFVGTDVSIRAIGTVVGADVDTTFSEVIVRTITSYVTEFGPLYMIGAGVGGWDWAESVEVYGTGPSQYSVIAEFTAEGDGNFRFFEVQGDWDSNSYNYTFFEGGTIDPNLILNPDDADGNFKFIGTTGFYRIYLDLKAKSIVMEQLPGKPTLYMVGSGVPDAGWDWTTPIDLEWVRDGVFEGTTSFAERVDEEAFRFFTINGDWNSGKNYPDYANAEYEIDSKLINAMDGDQNFALMAPSGTYKIVVNDIEKTIILADAGTAGPPKYLVGDGTSAGWDWATPVELVQVSAGVFVGDTEFNAAGAFRVFGANGDWNSGINFPAYVSDGYTIDDRFEDAADGDNNFKFTGADGAYRFTLDENAKTITLTFAPIDGAESKFLVGDGTSAGWDWATPVELIETASGVYQGRSAFNTAGAFRVFGINGDWNSGVNFPTYVADGYTIDTDFTDAGDGDNNFKFGGTDGTYVFTLDENAKTISLD